VIDRVRCCTTGPGEPQRLSGELLFQGEERNECVQLGATRDAARFFASMELDRVGGEIAQRGRGRVDEPDDARTAHAPDEIEGLRGSAARRDRDDGTARSGGPRSFHGCELCDRGEPGATHPQRRDLCCEPRGTHAAQHDPTGRVDVRPLESRSRVDHRGQRPQVDRLGLEVLDEALRVHLVQSSSGNIAASAASGT
jgi:hypothetical protein